MVDDKSQYKFYNAALQKAMKQMETKPHIPFFGLYLKKIADLTCRWRSDPQIQLDRVNKGRAGN